MNEKEQLEQEVDLAQMGKNVLNNEAYKQAFTARKAQIFDVFVNTKQEQEDVRQEAWRTMQNLNSLEEYFRIILETGKMAEMSLKSIK
jgi:hypothetical protein